MIPRGIPLAALVLLAACGKSEKQAAEAAPAAPAQPAVLTVTAKDYAFVMPDTIAPGVTTVELADSGKEMHQIQIFRLDSGKTMQDLEAALQKPDTPFPAWLVGVGGPNAIMPGASAQATLDLPAGHYVGMCFVPSPDGIPHFAKGMIHPLEVTGTPGTATMPAADVTIKEVDYAFEPTPALTAGHHTIRVVNAGTQDHELVLFKMLPGKTAADLQAWAQGGMKTPPPFTAEGGMGTLPVGGEGNFDVTLDAGNYVMVCFVPDAKDGKPHIEHGMVTPFTIE